MFPILESIMIGPFFEKAEGFLDGLSRGMLCCGALLVSVIPTLRSESSRLQVLVVKLQFDFDFTIADDCSFILLDARDRFEVDVSKLQYNGDINTISYDAKYNKIAHKIIYIEL